MMRTNVIVYIQKQFFKINNLMWYPLYVTYYLGNQTFASTRVINSKYKSVRTFAFF